MMGPRSRVRIARACGAPVLLALSGTAPAEPLANAPILAPTMDLTHHLA